MHSPIRVNRTFTAAAKSGHLDNDVFNLETKPCCGFAQHFMGLPRRREDYATACATDQRDGEWIASLAHHISPAEPDLAHIAARDEPP
jgi:hypothetical protein